MGYFSNGCEGDWYENKYCDNCIHQDAGENGKGCAIWLIHMLHNYGQEGEVQEILNTLIPRSEDGFNEQCSMYTPGTRQDEAEAIAPQPKRHTCAKCHGNHTAIEVVGVLICEKCHHQEPLRKEPAHA